MCISQIIPVISGVPQGSIPGPLLFINDLSKSVTTSTVLFADDAKYVLLISSRSDCLRLQNDLTRLFEWCTTWNLSLNEEKCAALHYTCSARRPCTIFKYSLNEKQISSKSQYKDLGLIASADLSWRPHYQLITSRAYKMLGLYVEFSPVLGGICQAFFIHLLGMISASSVFPHLTPSHVPTEVKCLELVQRRATKFIRKS